MRYVLSLVSSEIRTRPNRVKIPDPVVLVCDGTKIRLSALLLLEIMREKREKAFIIFFNYFLADEEAIHHKDKV